MKANIIKCGKSRWVAIGAGLLTLAVGGWGVGCNSGTIDIPLIVNPPPKALQGTECETSFDCASGMMCLDGFCGVVNKDTSACSWSHSAVDNAQSATTALTKTFKPGESFTLVWEVQNTGTKLWSRSEGYHLKFSAGDPMGAPQEVSLPEGKVVLPKETFVWSVPMVAPSTPLQYTSAWQMAQNGQGFGQSLTMTVTVSCATFDHQGCQAGDIWWFDSCDQPQTQVQDCGSVQCCGGTCVDLLNDPKHCGSCDNACRTDESCSEGSCSGPGSTCSTLGTSCGSGGDCCDSNAGAICHNNSYCCWPNPGASCASHMQCCGSLMCNGGDTNNRTCCASAGSSCSVPSDCCGALSCDNGICRESGSGCSALGTSCSAGGNCCDSGDGAICYNGSYCCWPTANSSCNSHMECCGSYMCVGDNPSDKKCCLQAGSSCTYSYECCGALNCLSGTCG